MTALYIVLIILSFLAVIAMIPVRVIMRVNMEEQELFLKYAFIKIILYPRPEKKEEKSDMEEPEDKPQKKGFDKNFLFEFIKEVKDDAKLFILRLITYLIKHGIRIRELNISAVFGVEDPAYTGMLCSAVYSMVYGFMGVLDRHANLDKWDVRLSPDFNNAAFAAGVYAELRTRLVHFIVMLFIMIRHGLKIGRKYLKLSRKYRKEQNNG